MVAIPTTGTSNRMSCFGLATLTMRTPATREMTRPADHLVGPFHRLDGDDRLVLHGDRLADVERGNGIGDAIPELEVRALPLVWRAIA